MAETVSMPKLGFDMAEGTLVRWVRAEGETVNKGDVLAEIETDKATVEVELPFTGTVLRQLVEEKTSVPVGTPIAIVGEPGEKVEVPADTQPEEKASEAESASQPAAEPAVSKPGAASGSAEDDLLRASPLAKKMAEDAGLDLGSIAGSGPKGRIVKKDVEAAMAAVKRSAPAAVPPAPAAPAAPAISLPLPSVAAGEIPADQHIPLDRLRSAIGRRMTEFEAADSALLYHP